MVKCAGELMYRTKSQEAVINAWNPSGKTNIAHTSAKLAQEQNFLS